MSASPFVFFKTDSHTFGISIQDGKTRMYVNRGKREPRLLFNVAIEHTAKLANFL
jgi:hypothetical protein